MRRKKNHIDEFYSPRPTIIPSIYTLIANLAISDELSGVGPFLDVFLDLESADGVLHLAPSPPPIGLFD
jgi:hypothetical protein